MDDVWQSVGGSAWRLIAQVLDEARVGFNRAFSHLEPWQLVSYTISVAFLCLWFRQQLKADRPLSNRIRAWFFQKIRRIPWVAKEIDEKMAHVKKDLEEYVHRCDERKEFYKFIPERGLNAMDILREAEMYDSMGEFDFDSGRASGVVYADNDEEHRKLLSQIFSRFVYSDMLRPDLFPGCRKMEAEVVRIACSLFNGGTSSCGAMTADGTESILLACLVYRTKAYQKGVRRPEMVVPVTAHVAFHKAAHLFNIRIRHVAVKENQQVDVGAMKRSINNETCLLVASAPNCVTGVVDNVEAVAELGQRYSIPVHVDAGLGGFLLPFMERCDFPVPLFDFRVAGVTSVSCDLHKYGLAPTGSSLILYREMSFLHHQYFCISDWPGGIYATPTLSGNRSGCSVALAWATLLFYGRQGYVERTRVIIETSRAIQNALNESPYLRVIGNPELSVIAFTSDHFNVHALVDRLESIGWSLIPLQNPTAVQICVTINHTKAGVADEFLRDLNSACEELVADTNLGSQSRTAAIYGMASTVPDKSLVEDVSRMFLDSCYATPQAAFPTRTLSFEGRKMSMMMVTPQNLKTATLTEGT